MTSTTQPLSIDRFCMLATEKERILSVMFVYNNCSCIESMIITLRVLDRFLIFIPSRSIVKHRKGQQQRRSSTRDSDNTNQSKLTTPSTCDQHTLLRLLTVIAFAVEKFIGIEDTGFSFYSKTMPFDSINEIYELERYMLDMIDYSIPWVDDWLLFYERNESVLQLNETMILVAQMHPKKYTFEFFESRKHVSDKPFDRDRGILSTSKMFDFLRCLKITY